MISASWLIEPWQWFALGVVLLIVEMFTFTFATLWFGIAAIIVALLSWLLPISTSSQIITWLVISIICVVIWFKYIKPLSVDKTKAGLGASIIVGEIGIIINQPTAQNAGTVRFHVPIAGSSEWQCLTYDKPVSLGDRVVVKEILGNELVVSLAE